MPRAAIPTSPRSLFPDLEAHAPVAEAGFPCEHRWIGTGVEFFHGDREVLERWCPDCGASDYVFRRERRPQPDPAR